VVSSADIEDFGRRNGMLGETARRRVRELVAEGELRRIPAKEYEKRNLNGHMGYYEPVIQVVCEPSGQERFL